MDETWFNLDPNDGFIPDHHGVDMDEIAKIHAMLDMEESHREWAKTQAERFYNDFIDLDVERSVKAIQRMIKLREIEQSKVNLMLDNMIVIFEEYEEYERCHICLQIKNGINDRI